ncbi:hypothetical protein [Fibrobacter sp. UWEL]|uniref:hypothetical protein n=1 Tax=Fibrobacter sp. UWEL TaxID=1896209 RepID=UPI00090EF0F0|nr:hypothetical protein [Fibrobacter sp. UWEL]SHK84874.1 hypothetical protein SAMN05720468_10816 [Fibrobacter sp. UWEL]
MVRFTKILSILICCSVLLGTTGCAYNSTNPIARYASYGGTYGSLPGLACLAIGGAAAESDEGAELAVLGLVLAGAGFVGGVAIGGTVGLFRWFLLGDLEPYNRDDGGIPPELYEGTDDTPPKYKDAEPDPARKSKPAYDDPWQKSPLAE